MIFSTLLLASPFLIQEPGFYIPITHTDEAAAAAYSSWTTTLPKTLNYPVQMYVGFEMGMTVPSADMDMAFVGHINSLSDSPEALRIWGDWQVQMELPEESVNWEAEFAAGANKDGLRMVFEDDGTLEEEAGITIPAGFTLSADRIGKISDLYLGVFESMPSIYGEEIMELFRSLAGPGELMHPSLWSRYMTHTEGWSVVGWGEKDGRAAIELDFDIEVLKSAMQGAPAPFDWTVFEDLKYHMIVEKSSGAILEWKFDMDLPVNLDPNQPELSGQMTVKMEMRTVPVSESAPTIDLPTEGVMNLDPHFDNYYPMMEVIMGMAVEQAKQAQGEQESEDDFEF